MVKASDFDSDMCEFDSHLPCQNRGCIAQQEEQSQ